MSKQKQEEIQDPKSRSKSFKERIIPNLDFKVEPSISKFEQAIMEYAEHPVKAKEFANLIIESIPVEKILKKSGIDLEKEKKLSEEKSKEFLELIKTQIKTFENLAKEISDLNKNIEIINTLNNNFQKMKKVFKMFKKKHVEKKDPFKVSVPKNFWKSILEDEDILSDEL